MPALKANLDKTLLFGLSNGSLVNVLFNADKPSLVWNINTGDPAKKSGISLIKPFDFMNRGINDLILTRDDSTIEFLSLNSDEEYEIQYKTVLSEGITGLDAGNISVPGVNEFVISTYSGRITGFLDAEEIMKKDANKQKDPKETEKKMKSLRAEIDKLKQTIDQLNAEKPAETTVNTNTNTFKISHKIVRNSDDASYSIYIDSQYPMETVAVQSMVSVELLDIDSSIAILSLCPEDLDNKSALSATYRFVENNVSKFEIKLRTVEGQYGDLNCFVIPNANPKTCQVISIPIKPLSLHERLIEPVDEKNLSLNTLKITGNFTKNDISAWVNTCLPDLPNTAEEDEVRVNFTSSFVGTILLCYYKAGSAIFQSDSISTITIIKDVISHEASFRNIHISINSDFVEDTIKRILELLAPKFEYYQGIAQKYQMLNALKELENQEGNSSFLSRDFQDVLKNAEEIQKNYKLQPKKLQLLRGIVTDLYVDRAKAKGIQNFNKKMPSLINSLNNFDLKTIYSFFMSDK